MFNKKTLTDLDIKLLKEQFPKDYEQKIAKINEGYPIQYIIGNVPFLNVLIKVNQNVLIPRFETEYLVEKILRKVEHYKNDNLKFLDICTGSGCIAIAIAKNTKFICHGLDISEKALDLANENSDLNNVQVDFQKHDILNESLITDYDIIISNPPYIKENEPIDNEYEPRIALYAPNDGLLFYQKILTKIKNKPKLIAFEIGETQGDYIYHLAKKIFPEARIFLENDLNGKERYIFIEQK